jgi:hypothetical protein
MIPRQKKRYTYLAPGNCNRHDMLQRDAVEDLTIWVIRYFIA